LALPVLVCALVALLVAETVSDWLKLFSKDVAVEVAVVVVWAVPTSELPVSVVVLVAVWKLVAVTACV
jgi:hypothetical protein